MKKVYLESIDEFLAGASEDDLKNEIRQLSKELNETRLDLQIQKEKAGVDEYEFFSMSDFERWFDTKLLKPSDSAKNFATAIWRSSAEILDNLEIQWSADDCEYIRKFLALESLKRRIDIEKGRAFIVDAFLNHVYLEVRKNDTGIDGS